MPENIRDTWLTTRKPHMCHGCLRLMPKCTRMRASTNVDMGDIYTLYICNSCDSMMSEHDCQDNDGTYQEGCCVETLELKTEWFNIVDQLEAAWVPGG